MDELTQLRSLADRIPAPDAERLDAGRTKLLEHIAASPRSRRARHPRLRRAGWISAATGVTAGVATVLVISNVIGLGSIAGLRGGADPAAAATLNAAAATTIRTSDPAVGPGQYLEVATKAVYSSTMQDDQGNNATYLASQDGQLYVPADTDDDWVWVRDPSTVVKTFDAASRKAAAMNEPGPTVTLRAPAGSFYNSPAVVSPKQLTDLPRDPSQLLNQIYRSTVGQGNSADGEALAWIADTLRSGIVPADLRAALYRAAAMIPGVEVLDEQAVLDGREGIAIGRVEAIGYRQEIVIDPTTGLLIGERETLTKPSLGMPAGTDMGYTAITTTVVDRAPAGGTVCGDDGTVPVETGGCRG